MMRLSSPQRLRGPVLLGPFHTFAYDGPAFARPVRFDAGKIVEPHGFVVADLLPAVAR